MAPSILGKRQRCTADSNGNYSHRPVSPLGPSRTLLPARVHPA